jgi:16S rRNA (guanine527-N7)-methyltransferase
VSGPDQAIQAAGTAFGRTLAASERAGLLGFFQLLLTWNARINLTGARSLDELIEEHLPDSLALARLVPEGATLVDVGAGGGLPALPLALLRPDVRVTVVEPRAKRVAFLRTAVRELAPEVEVVHDGVEALEAGGFDVASSRATFGPEEWLGIGLRLVRRSGLVVLFLSASPPPPGAVLREKARVDYGLADGRRRTVLAVTAD